MSSIKLGSIKIPQFDRVNYYLWKKKMTLFIEVANHLYMGSILENGPFVPMKMIPESVVDGVRVPQRSTPKDPTEFTDSEKEIVALDKWLQLIIFDSMDTEMCYQILNCKSGKQMWDTIVLIMEGTEEVKEKRLDILTSRYEAFESLPGETITQVFERYNRLLNELSIQGKKYPLRETNRKFLRTLPHHVEHKVSSIRERDNLNTMPLEELYGKLKAYEMEHELGHLATECKKPKQAKDKKVFYEKKSYEELKRENEKLKQRLDALVAKQQGKTYIAVGKSWDDTDSEEEEEYENLALMADSSEAPPSSQVLNGPVTW